CSRNFEDYDGLKRFTTNLQPGDSVTLTGDFSAQAKGFCIVTALGPPEGLSACANSAVPIDVAMAACNRVIESGQVVGNALGLAYASRGNLDDRRGDHDRAIADYTKAVQLLPKSAAAFFSRGREYVIKDDFDRALTDYTEAIRLNVKYGAAF